MHLQRLADVGIEDYWRLGGVYLARDFVSRGPEQTCNMMGLGMWTPGKQPGLQQKSRPLETVPSRCVCDCWFESTSSDRWTNAWGGVLEDGKDDECGLP